MEEENKFGELLAERRDPHREFLSTVRFFVVLLAVFLCFTILFTQIFIGVQVVGTSMEPTLESGDYLFINTAVSPEHGDIVVIEANEKDSVHDETVHKWIIKRVIGLPGDTIKAENGILYRKDAGGSDFYVVEEPYLGEAWAERNTIPETVVEKGEIFVLGDHRSVSLDSRSLGALELSDVMGVVTGWSLACKGFLTGLFGLF